MGLHPASIHCGDGRVGEFVCRSLDYSWDGLHADDVVGFRFDDEALAYFGRLCVVCWLGGGGLGVCVVCWGGGGWEVEGVCVLRVGLVEVGRWGLCVCVCMCVCVCVCVQINMEWRSEKELMTNKQTNRY